MTNELKLKWDNLISKYDISNHVSDSIWNALKSNYSKKNRYYHNFDHINNMLLEAYKNQGSLKDFDEVLLAIWFHDIIYKPTSKKNEEKSADLAKKLLIKHFQESIDSNKVYQLIMSTKKHKVLYSQDTDNDFLLDFDLLILGQDWVTYQFYIQKIRNEYSVYPNFLYNPARKKILTHFLDRESLFLTDLYKNQFEQRARENLKKEIELLS